MTITNASENHWQMSVRDITAFDVFLFEDGEEGIPLNMKVRGCISEDSSFTAGFEIEEMTD
ncbi:MAG: hypothetical protein IKU36_03715 [Bacteroidales bacterium]|nr:hypothetical protein [Bacteroidales bacterium]